MNRTCLHGFASGRVQGVGYRAFTQIEAEAEQLCGWVRNVMDGRVEFVLAGDAPAVERVLARLREGPLRGHVTALETQPCADEHWASFRIVR